MKIEKLNGKEERGKGWRIEGFVACLQQIKRHRTREERRKSHQEKENWPQCRAENTKSDLTNLQQSKTLAKSPHWKNFLTARSANMTSGATISHSLLNEELSSSSNSLSPSFIREPNCKNARLESSKSTERKAVGTEQSGGSRRKKRRRKYRHAEIQFLLPLNSAGSIDYLVEQHEYAERKRESNAENSRSKQTAHKSKKACISNLEITFFACVCANAFFSTFLSTGLSPLNERWEWHRAQRPLQLVIY